MTPFIKNAHLATDRSIEEKATLPAKILIVDDDFLVLSALGETLRREGYEVFEARSGQEALLILNEQSIALILCDQRMPVMSGLEILRFAQQIRPDAVRIALTGNSDRETVVNAINIGQVSQFISKPWDDAVLHQVISNSLEKRSLSLENIKLQHLLLRQNNELAKINELMRYEMELGAQIHKELLLGKVPEDIPSLSVAVGTVASKEVDGDFFDFYHPLPHVVDVVIGDVMGKGIPAALVGTAIKSQLQRFAVPLRHVKYCDRDAFWLDDLSGPAEILSQAHQEIARQLIELEFFVCLFYGRFDFMKKTFTYVDCGSTKPIHFKPQNQVVRFLKGVDFPVGMVEKNDYHEFAAQFDEGDLFIFYSDGITESRSPEGELYGLDRLAEQIKKNGHKDEVEVLQAIKQDVLAHAQKEGMDDDLTLLVVKLREDHSLHSKESLSASYLNDLSQLDAVRRFIKRVCDAAPGDSKALHQTMELAINESFCNIVEHGYKNNSGQIIYLRAQYHQEGLWVEVSDQGECFNPASIPEPSIVDAEEGGYGLFIIRQLADKLMYLPKSAPDGWNHLRIYKRYIFREDPMELNHTIQNKVLVVTPVGPSLDAREAREFKEKILDLINKNNIHSIVVDMHTLQFIDSSGLGIFLSILKALHAQGGELKLANLNKPIRTIFELVSMHKIFEIYNTTEEAVLSFN